MMLAIAAHWTQLKDSPRKSRPATAPNAGSRLMSTPTVRVGSRGIANIATVARSVVQYWISRGMQPFIFPAMGSHGAATAEGDAVVPDTERAIRADKRLSEDQKSALIVVYRSMLSQQESGS